MALRRARRGLPLAAVSTETDVRAWWDEDEELLADEPTPLEGLQQPPAAASARDFVHLHVHSEYSLLDGLSPVRNIVDTVKSSGMRAVALTDHGNLYGAIDFYSL